MWNASPDLFCFAKNITEVNIQVAQGLRVPINRQCGFVEKSKTTQFINPVNMVGVVMSIKDSINVFDSVEQALLSEVGRCIDKNGMVFIPDKN